MEPQRRLWSTSGLPPRHGTALGLGCYESAMWSPWGGMVLAGAKRYAFQENGPLDVDHGLELLLPRCVCEDGRTL